MSEDQTKPVPGLKDYKKRWTEIPVTRETRQKLAIAKAKYGFRSYDELIQYLLEKTGHV
jgi:hypothetical protein